MSFGSAGWRVLVILVAPAVSSWATWDPSVLNVPWSSDFNAIAQNEINVKTDSRLAVKAVGDGQTDDTAAIRQAIALSSSTGGGTVYFPAGQYECLLPSDPVQAHPIAVPSRVILRGDDPQSSRLLLVNNNAAIEGDGTWQWAGLTFEGSSMAGMTDLGVVNNNSSQTSSAVLWNRPPPSDPNTTDVFFNDMDIHLSYGKSMWFQNTTNFLFQKSMLDSTSLDAGPIFFINDTNVMVRQSTVTYHYSRVHMQFDQTALVSQNAFIRDAQGKDMDDGTAIESGGLEVSFGSNFQILNNLFEQNNTPLTEFGDGEAITSQHSTTPDVQDLGSVTAISLQTLTDTNALWNTVFQSMISQTPKTIVAFISGHASGTWRTVTAVDPLTKTITVDQPFSPAPDIGDLYVITRWTFSNSLIQNNLLVNNPHGIPIWDGALNVTVDHNTFYDSNNLLFRISDTSSPPFDIEGRRWRQIAFHNKVTNNTLFNTRGVSPSQVMLDVESFFQADYRGMSVFDIQISGNQVYPNPSNPSGGEFWGQNPTQDGFYPCYAFGPGKTATTATTAIKNAYFWNNTLSTPITYTSANAAYGATTCVTSSSQLMGTVSLTPPTSPVPMSSTLVASYGGGAAADHFEWELFPTTATINSAPTTGSSGSGTPNPLVPVEFTTKTNEATLGQYTLLPVSYQLTVEAIDSAGNRSMPATGSIIFLPSPQSSPTGSLLLGQGAVRVYPNPWREDKNALRQVFFSGFAAATSLKLFSVSGRLVKTLTTDASGDTLWDLTNESGGVVASGLYLYLGRNIFGSSIHGKIAVLH